MQLLVQPASLEDIETIVRWRAETSAWLQTEHKSDQWSSTYPRHILEKWVERNETWMVTPKGNDDPIATFTLSSAGSPDVWSESELKESALYLNKLNVKRTHAGMGIGKRIMEECMRRVAKIEGKLRIDVWTTNQGLRKYYERLGFRYVRTVPNTVSGALYEVSPGQFLGGSKSMNSSMKLHGTSQSHENIEIIWTEAEH